MHIYIPELWIYACGGGCAVAAIMLGIGAFLSNREHRKIQARLERQRLEHQYPPPVNSELEITYYPPIDPKE